MWNRVKFVLVYTVIFAGLGILLLAFVLVVAAMVLNYQQKMSTWTADYCSMENCPSGSEVRTFTEQSIEANCPSTKTTSWKLAGVVFYQNWYLKPETCFVNGKFKR